MDNSPNKTPPPERRRNEESCENGRRVVGVPIVVEPVHVPVPLAVIPVEVQRIAVAVRVPEDCVRRHLYHCSSKRHPHLQAVSNAAS